jgi:hypothetical protein
VRVAAQTILPVPIDEAWRRLLVWEEQARWMRDADSVRVLTAGRAGVGVRVAVRTRVLNVPLFTEELEVTLWEPPGVLVMAHRGFVRGTGTWSLAPAEGGAAFRWVEDLTLPVPVLGEIALRAYRPFMRRLMTESLAGLRELLATEST